jgi:hypothetical protein
MSKPIVGLTLGGILGALDGLSAFLSAPEVKPMIAGIVIGSGLFARRKASMPAGLLVGFGIGLLLAFIIAAIPEPDGSHYWWEIMLPGSLVGLIVGYATQRYGWTVNDVTNRLAAVRRAFRGHVLRLLRNSCSSDEEFEVEAAAILGVRDQTT